MRQLTSILGGLSAEGRGFVLVGAQRRWRLAATEALDRGGRGLPPFVVDEVEAFLYSLPVSRAVRALPGAQVSSAGHRRSSRKLTMCTDLACTLSA